jgi:hypothetical protein
MMWGTGTEEEQGMFGSATSPSWRSTSFSLMKAGGIMPMCSGPRAGLASGDEKNCDGLPDS